MFGVLNQYSFSNESNGEIGLISYVQKRNAYYLQKLLQNLDFGSNAVLLLNMAIA